MGSKTKKSPIIITSGEQYANNVIAHANLSATESLYGGSHYENLANYLRQSQLPKLSHEGKSLEQFGEPFVWLQDLNLSDDENEKMQCFSNTDDFIQTCDRKLEQESPSLILFMRGLPSPTWLQTIGWKCNVDPEFFLRHLDFMFPNEQRAYFSLPALPSSAVDFMRLRIPSVGISNQDYDTRQSQSDIDKSRETARVEMAKYTANLVRGNSMKIGDSIVRSFAIHDHNHFSLEQDLSACVNSFGKGWICVVWTDNGRDLSEGLYGPWCSKLLQRRFWMTSLNPTIRHRPNIALKSSHITPWRKNSAQPAPRIPQSISTLHQFYGRLLNREALANDAFYALNEIFTFAASAESQFLNMVETKVVSAMDTLLEQDAKAELSIEVNESSISNLLYNKRVLDQHIRRLKENLSSIKTRRSHKWPETKNEKLLSKVDTAAESLIMDFEYLLERAKKLSDDCDRGIDISGNKTMVLDSRASMKQQNRVSKLTFLAFLYIPATFTTSVFGMNFVRGDICRWLFPVILLSTYVASLLLIYVDVRSVVQRSPYKKMRSRVSSWIS